MSGLPIKPKSVLASVPDWEKSEVPAAYRALVYEHLIDRLGHIDGISHVYRDGDRAICNIFSRETKRETCPKIAAMPALSHEETECWC